MSSQPAPPLGIPKSSHTCHLAIMDAGCDIVTPPPYLIEPKIEGYDHINLPTYAFYIKHNDSGRQLLFDLGCRKDWENLVPHIAEIVAGAVPGLNVTKNVIDIVRDEGVDLDQIEALVLSHWHFDHLGDPSKLPRSTNVVVGPGFSDAFLPGFPAKKDSPVHEADFEGRQVIEPPFSDNFTLGRFQAHDYFGDGSLYVLNTPGHAIGHVSALVRTTPDTFVFLGGDSCHFTGVLRPSQYIPMPDEIPEHTAMDRRIPLPCPCSAFLSCHPRGGDKRTTPFVTISADPTTFYHDPELSRQTAEGLIEFDADPNILMAIAHDPTSLDVFDFFPQGNMNEWRAEGWKKKSHWGFLSELPYNGKVVRPQLVDGLYRGGQKVRGLELPR